MSKWMLNLLAITLALAGSEQSFAQDQRTLDSLQARIAALEKRTERVENFHRRFTVGGYGEAVMSRMFYSDNYKRYTNADLYKDDDGFGQFDLPHVVIYMGYDFGHGWTMGTEIEFEHGGAETAVEIEEEETGEYETETERGGEVALEQFWLQKSWGKGLNLRMGHIIVPVGGTNQHHMPNEFFTVYRPEGENTILPCTWHQTGISLWGRVEDWRYEMQFLPGLEADLFGAKNWVHGGSASPYEFDIANGYASVLRVDNYSVPGLRIGVSGYYGKCGINSLKDYKYSDAGADGNLLIGAVDFHYDGYHWVVRGNFDYGHLSDSEAITRLNKTLGSNSVSPQTSVASDAIAAGIEAGYDVLSQSRKACESGQKLYVFGRYDYYDSMLKTEGSVVDNPCWGRQKFTVGLNYHPIDEIIIKGEYSYRLFKSQFNDEPTLSLGICYSGFFR